ncbi:MAG: hypothetical protein BJ554DRAFT_7832, partial [Olpidium bornovanus]
MSPSCKLVFEVHSLRNASPATVSRCGMIYIGVTALTWDIILQAWFKTRTPGEAAVLEPLFNSCFGAASAFLNTELKVKMIVQRNAYVTNMINFLNGLIPRIEPNKAVNTDHLEKLFVFALMWSLGALCELDDRKKLQQFLLTNAPNLKYPPLDQNSADTIYEFHVADDGSWAHWRQRVPEWTYPQDSTPEFSSIIIPTVDNVRTEFLMDTIAKQGKGVLLIGEPGTAKTVTVQRYLDKLNSEAHLF